MIRKTVFWIHLCCGVAVGLVVLMMSATGVILTYERQMLDWQTRDYYADPPADAERLPIESIVASAALGEPGFEATSARLAADPRAPVLLGAGRTGSRYLNAYTGEVLGEPPQALQAFFGAVTGWHRWFNASGESRAAWRAVTGISNLAFAFLILSGLYLWLPRVSKWTMFKAHLLFNRHALKGKARDYNWHHVLGFWTSIPLFVVVATAVVFSYPWASNGVYRAFGEDPPAARGGAAAGRGVPPPGAVADRGQPGRAIDAGTRGAAAERATRVETLSLDALFARAASHVDSFQTITVNLPGPEARDVSFAIDQGNGGQPQLRHNLTLAAATGDVVSWQPFESQSPGRRARTWIRFLHTGEALGIAGQTVAGIVSLTSIIMVWTGLALAYRRLIVPLYRKRR
jgi:uncharacterized iron-regulated membrane protein